MNKKYIMYTIVSVIAVLLVAALYVKYELSRLAYASSGVGHSTFPINNSINAKFDYPIFKGWSANISEYKIVYAPKSAILKMSRIVPQTSINISPVLYEYPRDWSKASVNSFGVHYALTASSVEFEDGYGGGIKFTPLMNSAPKTLPIDLMLKTIADSFSFSLSSKEKTNLSDAVPLKVNYLSNFTFEQQLLASMSYSDATHLKDQKKSFTVMFSNADVPGTPATIIRFSPDATSTVWVLDSKRDMTPEYPILKVIYMYNSKLGDATGSITIYYSDVNEAIDTYHLGTVTKSEWKDIQSLLNPQIKTAIVDDTDRQKSDY